MTQQLIEKDGLIDLSNLKVSSLLSAATADDKAVLAKSIRRAMASTQSSLPTKFGSQ